MPTNRVYALPARAPFVPATFSDEDWQLIVNTLRNNSDSRSQELVALLQDWQAEIEVLRDHFERAKLALLPK